MLDTLLMIGHILRNSPDGFRHHRYMKHSPQREAGKAKAVGNSTQFFCVPVTNVGSFTFAERKESDDENLIRQLYYLNYKSSEADAYKKYIFGDIYSLHVRQGKQLVEDGNFRLSNENKKGLYSLNSFDRGESDSGKFDNKRISNFRKSFACQIQEIESFLTEHPNAFIHFNFEGKHWYQLNDVMEAINKQLLSSFLRDVTDRTKNINGYVLQKTLYKTLASAAEGPTGRVPNFTAENEYKNKLFLSIENVMDLIYVIDFSTKPLIRKNDIKIIVLPRGDNLTARQIEQFFTRQSFGSEEVNKAAIKIRADKTPEREKSAFTEDGWDEIFNPLLNGVDEDIKQFDFIFSKAGGLSSPDVDLLEIAAIERSLLEQLSERARDIRKEIEKDRPKSDKISHLSIMQSFLNILGDTTRTKKKYQGHLFKVLPQIYTGTYYRDDILLPALIEKTEFNIRNEIKYGFGLLKFDFYFLTELQNNPQNPLEKGNRMENIEQSSSYQIGLLLGKLATGLRMKINSFDKSYAGLLSRRIGSLSEVIRLHNEISGKLILHHSPSRWFAGTSFELDQKIKQHQKDKQTYNKNECAFGFYESYFAPIPKKEDGAESSDGESEAAA